MKNILVAIVVTFALSSTSNTYAQITKASINSSMAELGMTESNIETLYIGNLKSFYTDGTWKKTYSKYNKTWSDGTNEVSFSDVGVVLKTFTNAVLSDIRVYPFSSIINISLSKNYLEIHLKE